jgi:ribosomal protein S18 acetylase RimI-like enzyme
MSDLVLRPARPEEYGAVGEITVDVYVGGGFLAPDSSYVAVLRDAATRAEQAELLVAELGGAIVGTVTYCRGTGAYANIADPEDAEFRMLAVVPAARGNGIAGALVQLCIDKAQAAGCRALRLSTQTDMLVAQRLYERMGFVRTPDRDWRPGPDARGDILITYALPLGGGGRGIGRGRR